MAPPPIPPNPPLPTPTTSGESGASAPSWWSLVASSFSAEGADRSDHWPTAGRQVLFGALRLAAVALTAAAVISALRLLAGPAQYECGEGVVALGVAGNAAEAARVLAGCTRGTVSGALWWDSLVLVPAYVTVVAVACWFFGTRGLRVRRLRAAAIPLAGMTVLAGIADLVENTALGLGLSASTDTGLTVGDGYAAVASVAAWAKWLVVVVVVAYTAVAALAFVCQPRLRPAEPNAPEPAAPAGTRPVRIGISLSGGGVRSACFSLGAMQSLDAAGVVDRASYLSAVSGGSYLAGAWTIARYGPTPTALGADASAEASPKPKPWAAGSPEVPWFRARLGYLTSRDGGLVGAIATLLLGVAVNVAVLATAVWLLARPLGWFVRSSLVLGGAAPATVTLGRRLWLPALAWAVICLGLMTAWVLAQRVRTTFPRISTSWVRNTLLLAATAAAVVAVLASVALLAVPWLVHRGPALAGDGIRLTQLLTGSAAVAAVWGVVKRPLSPLLPRLGGLLVAAFALLLAAEVAARGAARGPAADRTLYLAVAAVFAVVYLVADPDWWSLQPFYRGRLRHAFASRRRPDGSVAEVDTRDEPPLEQFAGTDRPQLVVCTAMNVSGRPAPVRVGVPAYSFTFTPTEIAFSAATAEDGGVRTYRAPTAWYGRLFQRWDTPRLAVMTAVGMSGAAVSPAMGRFDRGTTRALLALANVRLGMWMPNPRYAATPPPSFPDGKRPGYPRRRIGYLFKEVFGVHDPEDLYVYVSDGGHWENLGLVELLRRDCTEIFCFDASGSGPGSLATLAEATTLAAQELGVSVEVDVEALRAAPLGDGFARYVGRNATAGIVRDAAGRVSLLWYARSALTEDCPPRLLAYREKTPIFPNHPTTDQFFDTEQFETYRLLGEVTAAEKVLPLRTQLFETLRSWDAGAPRPRFADVPGLEILDRLDDDELRSLAAVVLPADVDLRDLAAPRATGAPV